MYDALERVRAMIQSGVPFGTIEEEIDRMEDLEDEAKAALWLMAWAEQDGPIRHRVVRETLAHAST